MLRPARHEAGDGRSLIQDLAPATLQNRPVRDIVAAIMRTGIFVFAIAVLAAAGAKAADPLPIFDTHMHYNQSARGAYDTDAILEKMKAAGVAGALVSSTPDDGTLALFDAAPDRIVPGFRPYRTPVDKGSWYKNDDVLAYAERQFAASPYRTFGEVHIHRPENLRTAQMARYLELIVRRDVVLHLHTSGAVVDGLFSIQPNLRVLWAHAGFSEPPDVIGRLMDRHKNLWAGLSYRAEDIMLEDTLDPAWRELLIRHADRFTIGTDAWTNGRWAGYQGLIDDHRIWLADLPAKAARAIAHENAERLFPPLKAR